MYLNKAFIIGNLTRDPELKALPSGSKVCNLGLATNRYYKDKDGNKQETVEYHSVVAFGRTGELAGQYLKKGQNILVEGRIQTRSWDSQDGQKKYKTEIVAENIQFGNKPFSSGQAPAQAPYAAQVSSEPVPVGNGETPPAESGEKIDYPQEDINPDDIPF